MAGSLEHVTEPPRSAPAVPRSGAWHEDPGFGVYVHIPFCLRRCGYCDFNTYEGQDDLHAAYVDALVADIERWEGDGRVATSVFFGGGTPTLLPASNLRRVLEAVRASVGIDAQAEITVEANPETVDEEKFVGLLEAGFERFSIGVQSLAPHVLRGLDRTHPPDVALRALGTARRAGVDDLNADLIYGSPWEREHDWIASLEGVIACAPDHISAYALTIEDGTPLAIEVARGRVPDVDPDLQADRHGIADEMLTAAGYTRYEVSNWARPQRASRHNVLYWSAGDYAGFGAGAHGHLGGRRWWNERLPREFVTRVAKGAGTESGHELLGPSERVREAMVLGLRLTSGVDMDGLRRRFGPTVTEELSPAIAELVDRGLLQVSGARVALAPSATFVSNEVFCRLL